MARPHSGRMSPDDMKPSLKAVIGNATEWMNKNTENATEEIEPSQHDYLTTAFNHNDEFNGDF